MAAFLANLEGEVLRLERELLAAAWRPGRYVEIAIRDPKSRMVSAAPFRDRVVHHALCAVIEPLFECGFVFDSYANRRAKGTHRAVARYERFRDRFAGVLRCDIHRYFPAIDHEILKMDMRRRIRCEDTLSLVDQVIDGFESLRSRCIATIRATTCSRPSSGAGDSRIGNPHQPALRERVFSTDWTTSSREVLRAPGYLRYVDDFALSPRRPYGA